MLLKVKSTDEAEEINGFGVFGKGKVECLKYRLQESRLTVSLTLRPRKRKLI